MPADLAKLIQEAAENPAVRPEVPPLEARPLTFQSRRAGAIAVKAGMMQDWDEFGVRIPLTVLWIDECLVSDKSDKCGTLQQPAATLLAKKGRRQFQAVATTRLPQQGCHLACIQLHIHISIHNLTSMPSALRIPGRTQKHQQL